MSYNVIILNSPAVNAFALPGGQLYITRGLIALANDTSELASVLAHEMAHVIARHAADPRGSGAAGGVGQSGRQRRAQRSGDRRAGAGEIEDHAGELFARAGVRGRRHRRRHLPRAPGSILTAPTRFLTSMGRNAELGQIAAVAHIDPRVARLPVLASGNTRAHQECASQRPPVQRGPAAASATRPSYLAGSKAWSTAKTRAKASCADAVSCTPSSASPSGARRFRARQHRPGGTRRQGRRLAGAAPRRRCACRPSRSSPNISISGWIENIDPKSIEEFDDQRLPGGDRDREGRPVVVPALRRALRQRSLSLHLREQEHVQGCRSFVPRVGRHLPPHDGGGKPGRTSRSASRS